MTQVVLIVEPDAAGRAMMERILRSEGILTEAVGSIAAATSSLASGKVKVALVDEAAGAGATLREIRALHDAYPLVPVIAMGTLLTERVVIELLRMHVVDVLRKPFTPDELREGMKRAIAQTPERHLEALDYAAAMHSARLCLGRGELEDASLALRRARVPSAFDADAMFLASILAELQGEDEDATRGYRAALALSTTENTDEIDAYAGLARLEAYRGARPIKGIELGNIDSLLVVREPATELRQMLHRDAAASPAGARRGVLLSLDLVAEGSGVFVTRSKETIVYLVTTARISPTLIAEVTSAAGKPIVVTEASVKQPSPEAREGTSP